MSLSCFDRDGPRTVLHRAGRPVTARGSIGSGQSRYLDRLVAVPASILVTELGGVTDSTVVHSLESVVEERIDPVPLLVLPVRVEIAVSEPGERVELEVLSLLETQAVESTLHQPGL